MSVRILIFVLVLVASYRMPAVALGQGSGDLSVSPTRIVLEGNNKSDVLKLVNRGPKPAAYSLSFVQYAMSEDGRLTELPDSLPGMLRASDIVEYSPAQLTIAPGESKEITISAKPTTGRCKGEYRSHLYFRSIPVEPVTPITTDSSSDNFSVQLKAVFGVSVPVIVRLGNLTARAAIVGPEIVPHDSTATLNFQLRREGDKSLYGDITVTYQAKGAKPVEINSTRGLAVYTPNRLRQISLQLTAPESTSFGAGKYTIVYRDRKSKSVLAKRELTIH